MIPDSSRPTRGFGHPKMVSWRRMIAERSTRDKAFLATGRPAKGKADDGVD